MAGACLPKRIKAAPIDTRSIILMAARAPKYKDAKPRTIGEISDFSSNCVETLIVIDNLAQKSENDRCYAAKDGLAKVIKLTGSTCPSVHISAYV
jgi:hypothetical protein